LIGAIVIIENNQRMDYKVKNNTDESRFEALTENKVIGLIDYRMTAPDIMTVYHTEVGDEYEGRGIAGEMTKSLLDFLRNNQFKIRPVCAYAKAYIQSHPEYQDLVSE